MFEEGIGYLLKASSKTSCSENWRSLGNAYYAFSDHSPILDIRNSLKQESINAYRKAYEISKDPSILEDIREVEMSP